MMRRYINLIEAAQKGCPLATQDLDENLRNRQTAIDKYHYGPANPESPEAYWKQAAQIWGITEKTARTMTCGNCAAFDVSDKMRACMESGINGDDSAVDGQATINKADLGYCNFLHFKCAGTRSCKAWVTGGAIDDKDLTKK